MWCERPTSLGAVVAQVSYAYKKANAAVELFSAPLSLFVGLAWLVGITPVLIFVLWFPLGLGLSAVIVALVAAVAAGRTVGIEPGAPATRSPTDAYWRCAAPSRTGRFTRHGTGRAWPGNSAASAPSRSVGAAKGISTCGLLACGIRLRRSMWSAVQLWNRGASLDAASVDMRNLR